MEEIGYAKINLALHVRARETDGYHRLETLFAFAEDGDRLRVADSDGLSLTIEGPFAEGLSAGSDNLVIGAAEALRARCGMQEGAALALDKRLPVASGVGGGSADAAAALRLLRRWWRLDIDDGALLEIAATLGADVPACVGSQTVRGEGRGDELLPQDDTGLTGMPLLLVNPLVPLSTASVFAAWNGRDQGALPFAKPLAAALGGRNDLEAPAIAVAPVISEVLQTLHNETETLLVRMSGSGATCFALFNSFAARDVAEQSIAALHPDWWQLATRLR